jgi:CubicO group peptidase (beta-lactamase class C family)
MIERAGDIWTTRRRFLTESVRAWLGLSFLSMFGCSPQEPAADALHERSSSAANWTPLITDLEQRVPALLAQAATVPGLSMALIADGKLIWRGAYGVKDFASKTRIEHDTVFEAGSVSKTVFAYAVMKLCERGVLSLDTPLTAYTPDRFLNGDDRLDLITARHVLSHTTGFPNWRSKQDPLAIHFTPGERWEYSGEGYSYLQSVITRLAGHVSLNDCRNFEDNLKVCATDFDSYMKANLFGPFGMASSGYLYQEGMARPHDENGKMNRDRKATAIDAARYASAGGLHTTPTDYAKFLIECVDPKPSDAYRLSIDSLKEMVRPQAKVTESLSWGLGWAIAHKATGGDVISHSGDNPGFKAMAAASLERKTGFIIMTNGDRGFDEIIVKIVQSDPMQQFLPAAIT